MPVTAKLARKFYERLGDDIAAELVDWFNAVDATYQTQLKEMNELNWERFKATLQAEVAALRGEFRAGLADIRSELHTGLAELRAEMATLRAEFRGELAATRAELRSEMAAMRADLLKWMFVYWTGSVVTLGGLIVGMAMFGPR